MLRGFFKFSIQSYLLGCDICGWNNNHKFSLITNHVGINWTPPGKRHVLLQSWILGSTTLSHDLISLEQESTLNENSMSKKCTNVVSYKPWSWVACPWLCHLWMLPTYINNNNNHRDGVSQIPTWAYFNIIARKPSFEW